MANNDSDSGFKLYHYDPSLAAAVIFLILFTLLTCAHVYTVVRHKLWFFLIFSTGGLFEVLGFIGRAINATQSPDWALGPYILQSLFLLLPPALFAASMYMTLGRLIVRTDTRSLALVSPRWMTRVFVAGDVVSFLMQAGGGGMMASASLDSVGQNIILGGLVVQILWFGFFVVVAALWHVRVRRHSEKLAGEVPWRRYLAVLYVASALVFVRSVYRMVEYAGGYSGYLMTHEVFLYVLDALLMAGVMLVYVLLPPTHVSAREMRRVGARGGKGDAVLLSE